MLSFGASLQQFWVKKTRVGLGICINLGGSDTVGQALGSTAWGQVSRHLGKIYFLRWAGKFCLLKASKLSPEICSQARPAHKESCSQDWGAVQGSRQQGLEAVPVWGPWGGIFSPFIYLFKFLNILTTLHVHEVFLFPWPGIEPAPPTLAAWSPNNWTTGDVPT